MVRLRELGPRETEEAMAIAGALASWCPAEVIFGSGGTIKLALFGSSQAAAGIRAAHAEHGPPPSLDAVYAAVVPLAESAGTSTS